MDILQKEVNTLSDSVTVFTEVVDHQTVNVNFATRDNDFVPLMVKNVSQYPFAHQWVIGSDGIDNRKIQKMLLAMWEKDASVSLTYIITFLEPTAHLHNKTFLRDICRHINTAEALDDSIVLANMFTCSYHVDQFALFMIDSHALVSMSYILQDEVDAWHLERYIGVLIRDNYKDEDWRKFTIQTLTTDRHGADIDWEHLQRAIDRSQSVLIPNKIKTIAQSVLDNYEENLDKHNYFILLASEIITYLQNVSKNCAYCNKMINVATIKPFICDSDVCAFQFYELDLDHQTLQSIINEPQLCDILISLLAFSSRHLLPDYLSKSLAEAKLTVTSALSLIPPVAELRKKILLTNAQDRGHILSQILPKPIVSLLQWILLSNTAYLRKLRPDELFGNLKNIVSYKMVSSNPISEHQFNENLTKVTAAKKSFYTFHGSPLTSWHSIIREGLWFDGQNIVHGRVYGDGIYTSLNFNISRGYTGTKTRLRPWSNSSLDIDAVVSLNEVVNDPKFMLERPNSQSHVIITEPSAIVTRYLLIAHKNNELNKGKRSARMDDATKLTPKILPQRREFRGLDDLIPRSVHNDAMLPPVYATRTATKILQKSLKRLMAIQATTEENYDRPWRIMRVDDLYCWNVQLHSFVENSVLAKDMQKFNIECINLEVRFTGEFPFEPPFIRIVTPRFVQHIHGGGGHITAGGSICSPLLTIDINGEGWKPSFTLDTVFLQIFVELSSEPPARVASTSNYTRKEAWAAFSRVANQHGWSYPKAFTQLFNE